jgi:hypothetical protein
VLRSHNIFHEVSATGKNLHAELAAPPLYPNLYYSIPVYCKPTINVRVYFFFKFEPELELYSYLTQYSSQFIQDDVTPCLF